MAAHDEADTTFIVTEHEDAEITRGLQSSLLVQAPLQVRSETCVHGSKCGLLHRVHELLRNGLRSRSGRRGSTGLQKGEQ
jgi:hypothetical protein